jgi:hypothetical protein
VRRLAERLNQFRRHSECLIRVFRFHHFEHGITSFLLSCCLDAAAGATAAFPSIYDNRKTCLNTHTVITLVAPHVSAPGAAHIGPQGRICPAPPPNPFAPAASSIMVFVIFGGFVWWKKNAVENILR